MFSNDNPIQSAFSLLQERVELTDESLENRNSQIDSLFYSQKQSIAALKGMSECVDRMSTSIDNTSKCLELSIKTSQSSKASMAIKINDLNAAFAHLAKQSQNASPLQSLMLKISAVFAFFHQYLRHISARGIICGVVICNAVYIVLRNLPPKQWEQHS